MVRGRPVCDTRCRLKKLLDSYPDKVAREIIYAEEFITYCKANPALTIEQANRAQANIRNRVRVLQHRIKHESEESP